MGCSFQKCNTFLRKPEFITRFGDFLFRLLKSLIKMPKTDANVKNTSHGETLQDTPVLPKK